MRILPYASGIIIYPGGRNYRYGRTSRPIIQPGEHAPNFSLKDQDSQTFDLLEQLGKRVLLSFHPLAWTEFCDAQMISLEENQQKFGVLNTLPVGISVDSVPCKRAWANPPED